MRILKPHFLSATALVASLVLAAPFSVVVTQADEAAKDAIGTTAGGAKIPSVEEARAAKMMPDDPNPVPGQTLQPAAQAGQLAGQQAGGDGKPMAAPGNGDPTTATGGQAAVGGPMSPGASAGGQNSNTPGGASQGGQPSNNAGTAGNAAAGTAGNAAAETTGARLAGSPPDTRPGPIGATGQTMPSKVSQRNAILDHVPIMAMPLALTEPQRQRIYETVMADKRQPAAGADSLAPATFLSTEQALNEAQPMPDSLKDIELLKGLQYVKAKDKVLLVTPASRIVIDAITM